MYGKLKDGEQPISTRKRHVENVVLEKQSSQEALENRNYYRIFESTNEKLFSQGHLRKFLKSEAVPGLNPNQEFGGAANAHNSAENDDLRAKTDEN